MTKKLQAPEGGWLLVWSLSAGQLVSWGVLYYSFSLFVVPMEQELGWSRTALNGALSLGLLAAGLCAYPVGRRIDRSGGRLLMTLGSLSGAALFAAWSRVGSLPAFYAIWIGIGLAQACSLYEPVFAVLTRRFAESYRTRITALTLVGGFASTVFIPLTQIFIDWLGWRDALLALGACVFLVPLPVHLLLLRDAGSAAPAAAAADGSDGHGVLRRALRHPVFWSLVVCFTCYYATFSAMTFHLIPLLTERGLETAVIIAALTMIGPAQVAGRVIVFALARRLSSTAVGRVVVLMFPASVLLLIAFPSSVTALFAYTLLYGGANGIMTIIRGTAIADLLWREGYGATSGAVAFPGTLAKAAAPFAAALVWQWGGYGVVLWTVVAGGTVAAASFWLAASFARKNA